MKKIILVLALIGVMGIGGLIAVAGNNSIDVAAEPLNMTNDAPMESNLESETIVSKQSTSQDRLSIKEIEEKALQLVSGDGAIITDLEYERDGKWSHYEVEIITKEAEYELKLDAITGELLDKEVDRHDDDDDYYDEVYDDDYYEDRYDDDRYDD